MDESLKIIKEVSCTVIKTVDRKFLTKQNEVWNKIKVYKDKDVRFTDFLIRSITKSLYGVWSVDTGTSCIEEKDIGIDRRLLFHQGWLTEVNCEPKHYIGWPIRFNTKVLKGKDVQYHPVFSLRTLSKCSVFPSSTVKCRVFVTVYRGPSRTTILRRRSGR